MSQWDDMLGTAFSLAIVGYVINLAMGRTLAAKHGYDVDPNQVDKYISSEIRDVKYIKICILLSFLNIVTIFLYRKCWLLAAAIS